MPGRDLNLLAAEWLAEGLPADLPCAVVSRAAQPDQQVVHTTLGELNTISLAAAPSILIAGWAVREPSESNDAKSAKAFEDACRLKVPANNSNSFFDAADRRTWYAGDSLKSAGGEVANALVCKTSIRGFNSRPALQLTDHFADHG